MVLSGSSVTNWNDLTPNGHNTAQGTGADQPSYLLTGGPTGGPALQFNGTTQYLRGTWVEAQPVERYIVAQFTASGATGTIVDGTAGNDGRIFRTASNTEWAAYAGSQLAVSSGYTSTNWNAYGVLFDGNAPSLLFLNGVQRNSGNLGANSPSGITIGCYGGLSDFAPCLVTEVIDFIVPLTTAQRTELSAYFKAEYGPTV